jgi:hypothetical protein
MQENFPQKENFVKCDWPTEIFRRKKILKLKIFRNIFCPWKWAFETYTKLYTEQKRQFLTASPRSMLKACINC